MSATVSMTVSVTLPRTWTTAGMCAALAVAGGCGRVLDQDRGPAARPPPPSTGPAVATGERGRDQPLPGLTPEPKPFVDPDRFRADDAAAQPSTLLAVHASPAAPVPLSHYGRQPAHGADDFGLGPSLTADALRRRLGPPAGLAGIDDPWVVYRLAGGREMWLHFAGGDGPLTAADVVRGAETGYVRDRLYPTR